jgi:hypothetical protein
MKYEITRIEGSSFSLYKSVVRDIRDLLGGRGCGGRLLSRGLTHASSH